MPKRTDINSILILGAGPIVIGQACEFDYSGVQACKTLTRPEDGAVIISVNDFDKSAALKIGRDLSRLGVPLVTTLTAAWAAVNGIKVLAEEALEVHSLQALHRTGDRRPGTGS